MTNKENSTAREALAQAIEDHRAARDAVRAAEASLERAKAYATGVARDVQTLDAQERHLAEFLAQGMKAALAEGREPDLELDGLTAGVTRTRESLVAKARATDAAVKALEHELAAARENAARLERERAWAAERVVVAEAEQAAVAFEEQRLRLVEIHYRLAAMANLRIPSRDNESRDVMGRPTPTRQSAIGASASRVARDAAIVGDFEIAGPGIFRTGPGRDCGSVVVRTPEIRRRRDARQSDASDFGGRRVTEIPAASYRRVAQPAWRKTPAARGRSDLDTHASPPRRRDPSGAAAGLQRKCDERCSQYLTPNSTAAGFDLSCRPSSAANRRSSSGMISSAPCV